MAVSESWSVWAMPPPGPLADALQDEIDALARRFPDAPNFPPHVTLIGGFEAGEAEARAVLRALAAKLQPYRLTLDRVASGAIFHQCVFVLCAADDATMQAGAAAREAVGQDPTSYYMPHLSLLYSDIGQEQRQQVVLEEQAQLLEGQGAMLRKAAGVIGSGAVGFEVARIELWRTPVADKSLRSWTCVATAALGG